MRLRQSAALTAAAATALVAFPCAAVAAEPASTLYVNNRSTACSDVGSGSAEQPFCTITGAANAALPGQTVEIAAGTTYQETVLITRSGTPDKPITFVGMDPAGTLVRPVVATKNAVLLSGVHDVTVRNLQLNGLLGTSEPVVSVTDSSRVALDRIRYSNTGPVAAQLSGNSDHVTVSRSVFRTVAGGLRIGAGVHDSLVTANEFVLTKRAAIAVVDAPNTAVTNNTIALSCEESVRIDGASPGALIENNVITAQHTGTSACANGGTIGRGETEISVSAASTAGSKVDYNTVHPWSDASAYTWGGTAYPTAAAFAAAQPGQAAHDVDYDLAAISSWTETRLPRSATVAIDSADPTAPGVDTDVTGAKPTDDPEVANTAPGGGVRDRGAYEITGQSSATVGVIAEPSKQGPAPYTVKVTGSAVNDFGLAQAAYVFTFGDGTPAVRSTEPVVSHTYASPGWYQPTVTVADSQGGTVTSANAVTVTVRDPGELTATLDVSSRSGETMTFVADTKVSSPYVVAKTQVDYGDGTVVQGGGGVHRYVLPGSYTVTLTATDESGRTVVATKAVVVADAGFTGSLQPGQRVQLVGAFSTSFTSAGVNISFTSTGVNYTNGSWQPWTPAPQTLADPTWTGVSSMASATTADQYLRTFALVGGKIFTADRNLGPASGGVAQGQWLPWKEVTGPGALSGMTRISAASIGNSTHLVAVADGRVYEASSDRATGTWSKWGDITAAVGIPTGVASIAAGTTGNTLHVAVLGFDGHIRVADGDYTRGRWSYGDVTAGYGGPTGITQLAAASTPGSRFHVVALAGGRIHEITGDYAAGYWTGWGDISGASGLSDVQQVTAASTGNTIRIFAKDRWRGVSTITGDYTAGRWSGATNVSGPAVAGTGGTVDVITAAGL
ncbi:PKD domain-containing protein [Kitasatospora sp. NPDC048365]|uniref:PKD domain-containing protein n=1 Tax=Kitasatospora sp. NPDC048365 TaxID=3364050 RepID=UPI003720F623